MGSRSTACVSSSVCLSTNSVPAGEGGPQQQETVGAPAGISPRQRDGSQRGGLHQDRPGQPGGERWVPFHLATLPTLMGCLNSCHFFIGRNHGLFRYVPHQVEKRRNGVTGVWIK